MLGLDPKLIDKVKAKYKENSNPTCMSMTPYSVYQYNQAKTDQFIFYITSATPSSTTLTRVLLTDQNKNLKCLMQDYL